MKRASNNNIFTKRLVRSEKLAISDRECINTLIRLSQDRKDLYKNVNEKVGYEVLAPILVGYSSWLHEQIINERVKTVFFLSREGKILLRAYTAMYGENTNVKLSYVNVSRLALTKATLIRIKTWDEFTEKYATLLRGLNTIGELMGLLGISVSDEEYKKHGLNCNYKIENIEDGKHIYDLMMEAGHDYLCSQNELARKYLLSKGVDEGKIIIADIGWSGTMQGLISELFPKTYFIGCYIAVSDIYKSGNYSELDRRGFWVEQENDANKWKMIRFSQSAFELMFLGDEGTTTGYISEEDLAVPIKSEYKENEAEFINDIHFGAEKGVIDIFHELGEKTIKHVKPDTWFLSYIDFAIYPNDVTASFFRNTSFQNGVRRYSLIPDRKLLHYLLHLHAAYKEFELNNCKVIWLYCLLPIKLPYYRMLCFMTDRLRMKSAYEKKYLGGIKKC